MKEGVTDQDVLDFAEKWFKYAGSKERGIWEQFGMTAVAYHAWLRRLVRNPPADLAVAYGPTIRRLASVMDEQARMRGRAL